MTMNFIHFLTFIQHFSAETQLTHRHFRPPFPLYPSLFLYLPSPRNGREVLQMRVATGKRSFLLVLAPRNRCRAPDVRFAAKWCKLP